jgi:4a-hydroxytetrahydrobiopterin dehydratase
MKRGKQRPAERRTLPSCRRNAPRLPKKEAVARLSRLEGWTLSGKGIAKVYDFKDYRRTLAFVNAVARMAEREDHHPELSFGYKDCRVFFSTHSAGGLSENDFICAVRADRIFGMISAR